MKNARKSDVTVTVLIVEDDEEELAADCRAIGKHFPVLTAGNADDALRLARGARPSAIVLDVMMAEGRDGFSIFRELRNDPATRGIPVIFLTSVNRSTGLHFDAGEIQRYLGAKPAAFLEKPISAERLLAVVNEVVERRSRR